MPVLFFLLLESLLYSPEACQRISLRGIQPDMLLSQLFLETEQVAGIARNAGKICRSEERRVGKEC